MIRVQLCISSLKSGWAERSRWCVGVKPPWQSKCVFVVTTHTKKINWRRLWTLSCLPNWWWRCGSRVSILWIAKVRESITWDWMGSPWLPTWNWCHVHTHSTMIVISYNTTLKGLRGSMYDLYTQLLWDLTEFVSLIFYDYGLEVLISTMFCVEKKIRIYSHVTWFNDQ